MARGNLISALDTIAAARRDAQAELDEARTVQLAAAEPATDEQLLQTLGALVRQLDNAGRELADAIRTVDQRDRLAAKTA